MRRGVWEGRSRTRRWRVGGGDRKTREEGGKGGGGVAEVMYWTKL